MIERRLERAREELEEAEAQAEFPHVIVNDDLERGRARARRPRRYDWGRNFEGATE